MEIREIREEDLVGLLELYTELHDNPMPVMEKSLQELWRSILNNPDHHILIGTIENCIISSCVLMVVRNLTHHQRPYALIENVITSEKYRNHGYATELLQCAKEIAVKENCYKIMLLTGSKKDSTLSFYEKAGYNRKDKTAFIQWIP